MPCWCPSRSWECADCAYIIGGGPSLRGFDFSLLKGYKVIGCNSAYLLGASIVDIVVFGDMAWWRNIGKDKLPEYGGIVVGCPPSPAETKEFSEWVLWMDRSPRDGLSNNPSELGFNGNTGSLAINLALLLGVKKVYLLGFDMKGTTDNWNWHTDRHEVPNPQVIPLHKTGLFQISRDLPKKFPSAEVINVSDVTDLKCFPIVSLREHFKLDKKTLEGSNK